MPRDDRWDSFAAAFSVDDKDDIGISVSHGRQSFSYYRLPEPLFKLSVLKLDGSTFDVKIERTANVKELKLAVEDVFSQSPLEGGAQISWSHVWSYFCLCYDGYKLIDDRASVQSFGIRDGTQLQFIRHLSPDQSPTKGQPRSHWAVAAVLRQHTRSLTAPQVVERFEENISLKKSVAMVGSNQCGEKELHNQEENEGRIVKKEFSLSHLFRRWFSYTKLRSSVCRRLDVRLEAINGALKR